uniref:Putative peptidase n=1 Tax=viral metagenome TaxID=1070528 RepID=A0A6M3M4K9_9ZZZZ
MITKKVFIKFKPGLAGINDLFTFMAQHDASGRVFGAINVISQNLSLTQIGKLKLDKRIEYVEYDQDCHLIEPKVVPLDQAAPWGIDKIRAREVHSAGNKGTGIKVCIIDTGIDYTHEDLKANYNGGYNFVANTPDPLDDNGHGTHVAGTIAAEDNDCGVIGVAPEAKVYCLKVLDSGGSGSYSNIVAAIQWAIDNKMQIVSMSLGGSSYSKALEDICNAAYNAGILIIAAAGNSGGDGGKDTVGYPAKFESVMAIAATDSDDVRAPFSSAGPAVEVAAPGVGVISSVPLTGTKYSDPSGYKALSGTSMATPHTSGTAALVLAAHPDLTVPQAREIIDKATVDLGKEGRDVFYGFGRIDAKAAVDGEVPPPPPPPEPKKYRCQDGVCIEDASGPFNTIEECRANCAAPPEKKYKCTGEPDFQCVEDASGPYNSLRDCQVQCHTPPPPQKRYSCVDGQCIEDPNGRYPSLDICQVMCQSPPQPPQTKWRCKPVIIWQCVPSLAGYERREDCDAICNARNSMQQSIDKLGGGCC